MRRAKCICDRPAGPTALCIVTVGTDGVAAIGNVGETGGPDSAPASADTWFRLGSISKTLVAFAVLNYCDQNSVDLDAPFALDFAPGRGRGTSPATVRSLLSHTAGLCNGVALAEQAPGSPEQWLRVVGPARSRFSYSNLGYALLGHWMGLRTGLPAEAWLHRFAWLPLGIEGVAFLPPNGASAAIGHVWNPRRGCREPFTLTFGDERLAPAGFLWASPRGLSTVIQALTRPSSERLEKIVQLMATPQSESIGLSRVSYGLGLFTYVVGGRRFAFHDGEIAGFQALVEFDPVRRTGIGVLANMSGPDLIARDVLSGDKAVPSPVERGSHNHPAVLQSCDEHTIKTFAAPSLGVVQVSIAQAPHPARLNGVPFTLEVAETNALKGSAGGRMLVLKTAGAITEASYAHVNGQFAQALRPRIRRAWGGAFDAAWLGLYRNGYWIELYAGTDGRLRMASNYSGTDSIPLVLGKRCLATDLGIMLFTRRSGRRSLRLLGVNWFRREDPSDPSAPLVAAR